ncbi:hypothetical protein AMECASPLE_009510 [Ameca splendens]|uniref:Uncharacterized protein n=1 Tax=Ameca splendens TaxID=208324 RepID=A0ABV0XPD3_9TELE
MDVVCMLHAGCVFVLCFSIQSVTGRCCCTGVANLSAISWASYGLETQRDGQLVFSLGVIYLLPKEAVESYWSPVFTPVMFRGVRELQPQHLSPEPLLFPTANPACQEQPLPKL